MNKASQIRENLELFDEFIRYATQNPKILEQIPKDAELIILPENDTEGYRRNMRLLKSLQRLKRRVAVVRMKRPEKIPRPQVEIIAG